MRSSSGFLFLIIIFSICSCNFCFSGIFSWLFKTPEETFRRVKSESKENVEQSKNSISGEAAIKVQVPFEMKSTDEKFLKEASQMISIQLSNLDLCHHRVILNLQKSCSDLSEEELSKVAVNLLNCQSAVEERTVYPCTGEMSLRDCTRDMDETTWNAYHILSNRVRAVCYSLRQQQFAIKTELSVNKLMQSTAEQIDAMKLLERSQSVVKEATLDTLSSLSSGHIALQKEQEQLSFAHVNMRNYISSNIRELTREKRLIASGQKELSEIIHSIRKKLEAAQQQLKVQGNGQRESHQKILQDLSDIQESAGQVWGHMEQSTKILLERHEETVAHYARLMDDLQKMNVTVHHLMDILIRMKAKVEEKFSWISSLLGDTDATVQKLYSFILHICYCLLGMIAAIFLQVPYVTRLALIILVPLNAVAEMNNEASLPFSAMTAVFAVCMFFNFSTIGVARMYQWGKSKNRKAVCGAAPFLHPTSQGVAIRKKDEGIEANPVRIASSQIRNGNLSLDGDESEEEAEESFRGNSSKNKDATSYSSYSFAATPLTSISEDEEGSAPFPRSGYALTSRPRNSHQSFASLNDSVRRRLLTSISVTSPPPSSPLSMPLASPLGSLSSSFSGRRSRSSTPVEEPRISLSQSLTPKKICAAICKSGLSCRNTIAGTETFCHRHSNGISRESTPFR